MSTSRLVVIEAGRHELRLVGRDGGWHTRATKWPDVADAVTGLVEALHALCPDSSAPVLLVLGCQDRFGGHREALIGLGRALASWLGKPPMVRVACVNGTSWPLGAALRSPLPATRFTLPRAPGLRALAEGVGQPDAEAVVDIGASSAEWVRLVSRDPVGPHDHGALARLRDGRMSWIGLLDTPMDAVLETFRGWPVVPRHARIRAATRWLGLPPLPLPTPADRAALARELAAALALDPEGLLRAFPREADPFTALAQATWRAAVRRLARAWSTQAPPGSPVWTCGIGGRSLGGAALRRLRHTVLGDLEAVHGLPPGYGVAAGWFIRSQVRGLAAIATPPA